MSRQIKVRVKARDETGSPSVEDLLDQVRDYFEILTDVEAAVAEDGTNAIVWRVVSATSNTPIEFTLEAFPSIYGVNIDRRVDATVRQTALGLKMLEVSDERPSYFSDETVKRAKRMFERVTNGLDETRLDHGEGLPKIDLTPTIARAATRNTQTILTPPDKPYDEQGSVEGTVRTIGRDGFGRLVVTIRVRLTGEDAKCILAGEAMEELGEHRIKEITASKRIRVYGTLSYKSPGRLSQVKGTRVRFMRSRSELPDLDEILDSDFTGGLPSEEYLRRLRDGELS